MELVKLLGKSSFVEDIEDVMIDTLLNSENPVLITRIIDSNIDYLEKKKLLPRLLVDNNGHMFDILVQGGEGDIVDVILELAPETKIPENFIPIGSVIGREKYDLLKTLMTAHNVCLTKGEYYEFLLKKDKLDLLKLALEMGSRCKLSLLTSYEFGNFYKKLPVEFALELLSDDKINVNLWINIVLTKMYEIPGFTKVLEQNIDRVMPLFENHVISNIDWLIKSDTGQMFHYAPGANVGEKLNTPLVRILRQGTAGMNIVKRLLRTLQDDRRRELIHNIMIGYFYIRDIETIELLVRELSTEINELTLEIDEHLISNPQFILSNIDTLLRLFPRIRLRYISSFRGCLQVNPQLFVSSDICRKLLTRGIFNYNEIIYIGGHGRHWDDDEYNTQLYDLCLELDVDEDKTERMDAYLFLIRTYLENPEVNINLRNETVNEGEDITFLEHCVLQIKTFDSDTDYTAPETYGFYQEVVKMILEHPRLDIDTHKYLFSMISREVPDVNLDGLLTTVLSHPNIDINSTGALFNACSTRNLRILSVLLTIGALNLNLLDDDGRTPLHICIEENFVDGAISLLADPRIDITVQDTKGRNYARLAGKAGMTAVIERLAELGQSDDKKARVDREIAEYEARMAAQGRVKQTRIRETLNSFDLILKE